MSAAQGVRQLIAPWQWIGNEGSSLQRALRATVWLVVLVAPAAAALRWLPAPLAAVIVALLLAIALIGLWSVQFAALLRLDQPNVARLVPAHAARLRATALALWIVATAAGGGGTAALLAWAPLPAGWGSGPALLSVTLVAAGFVLYLVALGLRWPLLWVPIALLPMSGGLLRALLQAVQPHWQARPWLACAALLVAMAVALVALFGRGNAAHARAWEQRERWRRITQAGLVGQKPTLAAYGRWGEWLGAPWQRLADAWLAHVIRHARPTAASAMTRAEIALHGAQHWLRQLGVLVPLLVVLVAVLTAVAWHAGPAVAAQMFDNGHFGMVIGLLSMVLGAVVSLPGALWMSRREQALLVLLPGMPRGAALNRALAWRQARHFLLLWALTLPGFLGLAWAARAPYLLALPPAALAAIAWLWRDAARQPPPSALAALLPFVLGLVPSLGLIVLLREGSLATWPAVGGFAVATALLLLWRWRCLSRWPQALPAGRWG